MYGVLLNREVIVKLDSIEYKVGFSFRVWAGILAGSGNDYLEYYLSRSDTNTPSPKAMLDLRDLGITVVFPIS